ncbi:transcription factor bHLH25 [Spatholobus suberectus]|nr:transcription factor bHLH25 [Spatholobus suberectus]
MGFKNNKSNVTAVGHDFSEISDCLDRPTKSFPEVEARISAKDVLIRVICNKRKDIVTKLLSILAAHNLSIVDCEFSITMDDLVKILNKDLLKCCNLQQ